MFRKESPCGDNIDESFEDQTKIHCLLHHIRDICDPYGEEADGKFYCPEHEQCGWQDYESETFQEIWPQIDSRWKGPYESIAKKSLRNMIGNSTRSEEKRFVG